MKMHPGLHWHTVAKVLLYDAHIIYTTDSSSGGSRGSPTQRQIRREFQDDNALVNAFPLSDMPSPAEVGQLYQYPIGRSCFYWGWSRTTSRSTMSSLMKVTHENIASLTSGAASKNRGSIVWWVRKCFIAIMGRNRCHLGIKARKSTSQVTASEFHGCHA